MKAFRVTATNDTEMVADYIFSSITGAMEFVTDMINKVDEVKVERISVLKLDSHVAVLTCFMLDMFKCLGKQKNIVII